MKPGFSRHFRNGSIVLLLLGLAAWLVPSYFSAERYRRRLELGLERVLHRPVTFGALNFRLLPRPGFTIENATVREDPDFGSEPFAHVDRIECDLRWHSFWRSRLDFARLRLDHPSLNLVRNARGEWNMESLLRQSGIASTASASSPRNTQDPAGALDLEGEDARINFKVGADKKPFAVTDLSVRLRVDPGRHQVRFKLTGNPIRTDLSLPSPGVVDLAGQWTPGKDLEGPLIATLGTHGALLYDWVPLVTGRNPEVYGVLDAEIQLTGSLRVLNLEGQVRLTQLHRWEQLPPSDPMPWNIHLRGEFDRSRGRALVESLEAGFADSHLHVSGSINKIPQSPELDLVVALERSRLEDLVALGRRFWTGSGSFGLRGRVDGMLSIQGPWAKRRYGGFLGAREVVLSTPSGTFPVSELAVRIDHRGARLAPLKLSLAPRVELLGEGILDLGKQPPRYELGLSAKNVPLRDVLRFGRGLGVRSLQGLDASGLGTATFRLAGDAWPVSRPTFAGHAELRAARLLIPGLTEPLNIPQASLRLKEDEIIVDPVVGILGTSVFSGSLRHRGDRSRPWEFSLRANALSLEQGALWFDVLGRRRPLPLLERLPGLSSFTARRAAASNLFGSVSARGRFTSPSVTYLALSLKDFRAAVEISSRVIQVTDASFHAGGGRGHATGVIDLTIAPGRLSTDVSLSGLNVQAWVPRLPAALQSASGSISATGHLETRGLGREEMAANLIGHAEVRFTNFLFGEFDPLEVLARNSGWGTLEPARGQGSMPPAAATLDVRGRQVTLREAPFEISGAKLRLAGTYGFDGAVDLTVRADLRHVRRRWLTRKEDRDPIAPFGELHLAGPLDKLLVVPAMQVSRANP